MSKIVRLLTLLVALLICGTPARAQPNEGLLFFAAASLTDVLQDINKIWEAKGESRVRFNFAASSTLARQMEQGAVANLFASADQQWMDWAQARNLIATDTRKTLLGNRLVLVAPADKVPSVTIAPGIDAAYVLIGGDMTPAALARDLLARAAPAVRQLFGG